MTADGFLGDVQKELVKRLTKAGVFYVSQLRGSLNTSQEYTKYGSRLKGHGPSLPGQYPHKLSGQLMRSITWNVDKKNMVLTVGSNLDGYPSFLETGTQWMAPRPWLSLSFAAEKDQLGKIIAGK